MKQVVLGNKGITLLEVPAPLLEPRNALIATAYSIISTGTEMSNIAGKSEGVIRKALKQPQKIQKLFDYLQKQGLKNTVNFVQGKMSGVSPLGYSCSGVVLQVAEGIDDLKPGEWVACAGAGFANHAEYVVVPRNLLVKVPKEVGLLDAASTTLGAIAMQGVRRADLRLGEWAAVIGLGLLGQITARLLTAAGIQVIGIDLDPERVRKALAQGLTAGFTPGENDLANEIFQLTGGHGVDASILTAASKSDTLVQQAMEWTRRKGRVVVVGAVGLGLNRSPFYEKEIDFLISCSYGPGRYDPTYESQGLDYPYAYVRWTENRNMQEYLRLLAEKRICFADLVEGEYPLEQVEQAYASLSAPRPPLAVVLRYDQASQIMPPLQRIVLKSSNHPKSGQIRLALIGAGGFAQGMHLPNLMKLADQYCLRAVVSRTGTTAHNIGKQFGAEYITSDYQEVLDDPDIDMVLICTRHHLHAQQAAQAARAGKAIFLEKPMALTISELELLQTTLEETQVPFMVGFNRRFSPAIRQAKTILSSYPQPGMILYRVNAGFIPQSHWTQGPEGGGRMIGEGCHMLDVFQYLVAPARVSDHSLNTLIPQADHLSAADNLSASIRYSDGSLATLVYTALGAPSLPKEYIEIYSGGKTLVIEDFKTLRIYGSPERGWQSDVQDKGHLEELKQFGAYLQGKAPAPISLEDLVETTRLSMQLAVPAIEKEEA